LTSVPQGGWGLEAKADATDWAIADQEVGMGDGDSVGEEIAKLGLRPAVDDQVHDEV
jgi:hypothetical protein